MLSVYSVSDLWLEVALYCHLRYFEPNRFVFYSPNKLKIVTWFGQDPFWIAFSSSVRPTKHITYGHPNRLLLLAGGVGGTLFRLRFCFRSTRFPFLEDVNIGRHLEDWKLAQRLMYYWRWHDCAGGVGGVGESCWSVKGVGVWSEFSKHSGSGAPALTWARVTLNLLTRAYHTAWLLPTL